MMSCSLWPPETWARDAESLHPPSYPSVISVSAVDEDMRFADFSNANPFVDLAAPGSKTLGSTPDEKYNVLSGTSMATAYVSGVAALLWSYKPEADTSSIRDALFRGACPIGPEVCYGHGLVRATESLRILDGFDPPSASPISTTTPSITLDSNECVTTHTHTP
mmetsp:Transcript_4079/g.9275  ORF Transcript_4079/g.9275 Transcript_4079/m.9275 type:complete len:164 (-) Transcript_4079:60-551(-)